jgi:hypothetical protein
VFSPQSVVVQFFYPSNNTKVKMIMGSAPSRAKVWPRRCAGRGWGVFMIKAGLAFSPVFLSKSLVIWRQMRQHRSLHACLTFSWVWAAQGWHEWCVTDLGQPFTFTVNRSVKTFRGRVNRLCKTGDYRHEMTTIGKSN